MYCVFLENSEQQYISLIKGENMKKQNMFTKEYAWRGLMTAGGLLVIAITICIGAFLIYKGSGTFTIFGHSIFEFLGSTDWNPEDNAQGGGTVGALIFIVRSRRNSEKSFTDQSLKFSQEFHQLFMDGLDLRS